jgi:hypothetical protein
MPKARHDGGASDVFLDADHFSGDPAALLAAVTP